MVEDIKLCLAILLTSEMLLNSESVQYVYADLPWYAPVQIVHHILDVVRSILPLHILRDGGVGLFEIHHYLDILRFCVLPTATHPSLMALLVLCYFLWLLYILVCSDLFCLSFCRITLFLLKSVFF